MPPLIIYPEGGTTNGTALLKFKRGAFTGLNSIKPLWIKYEGDNCDMEGCLIDFASNQIINCSNFWCKIHVTELPVFEPNDYFFEHHQKKDEEKWQTYARVIRDLMIKHGNFADSE